jgi:hypothetical protein
MRLLFVLLMGAAAVQSACAPAPAHDYPDNVRAQFAQSCPLEDAVCACSWEKITRTMTAEEFEAATERYQVEGLVDPRLTKARTACIGG